MLTLYLMVSVLFSNASKSQFNKFCNFDWPEPGLIRDDIPRYLSSVILRRLISVWGCSSGLAPRLCYHGSSRCGCLFWLVKRGNCTGAFSGVWFHAYQDILSVWLHYSREDGGIIHLDLLTRISVVETEENPTARATNGIQTLNTQSIYKHNKHAFLSYITCKAAVECLFAISILRLTSLGWVAFEIQRMGVSGK